MGTRKIGILIAASLLVSGGVWALDDTDQRPQRASATEEQRQARQDRFEGMTDEELAAARGRDVESRRPGGFTEAERQAMRERREFMSDDEREAARERSAEQGGRFPGGDRSSGGRFPGGGQFPGGNQSGGRRGMSNGMGMGDMSTGRDTASDSDSDSSESDSDLIAD